MTLSFFFVALAVIVAAGVFWTWEMPKKRLSALFVGSDVITAPMVGPVAVILGFLIGFGGADMRDRTRQLHTFSQQEANEARTVLKYAEGTGDAGEPLRQAVTEYLEAATTRERTWMDSVSPGEPPAQNLADSVVLTATLFALDPQNPESLKNLLVSSVNRLRQARVERITLSRQATSLPEWIAISVLVLLTQTMIALTHAGRGRATSVSIALFTAAVVSVYFYLGWIDGLIGSSKSAVSIAPLQQVLLTLSS